MMKDFLMAVAVIFYLAIAALLLTAPTGFFGG